MSTKELIQAELDTLSDEDLEALYTVIKQFIESKRYANPRSLMATLRDIQIDAPPDFAANLDQYVSGEKRAEGVLSSESRSADRAPLTGIQRHRR